MTFCDIPLFNLVLAAGAGRRLSSVTGGTPKQFWCFDGRRTLLEHTLDRCLPLAPPARTRIVIDTSHRTHLARLPVLAHRGTFLHQPMDRGTAAGVLLALIDVLATRPDAVVMLMPSDHGIRRTGGFLSGLRRAALHVCAGSSDIVLFGITPNSADGEYGWITPERVGATCGFRKIVGFVEKPHTALAHALFETGAVWNTMVLVARASALAALVERTQPELWAVFSRAIDLSDRARSIYFDACYRALPLCDFSRDVLGRADGLTLYTWPSSLGWSDLGTPTRLAQWSGTTVFSQAG